MGPIEKVIQRLSAKRNGRGWTARCPAHDDKRASLSISEAIGGKVLIFCHAGCETQKIIEAVGLTMRDLFPTDSVRSLPFDGGHKAPQKLKTFPTARDAIRSLKRSHGEPVATWTFREANGDPVGCIIRWDSADGKIVRPVALQLDGTWSISAMLSPRPLYRLPELLKSKGRVYIVEGEKCVDALASIGLTATTSSGGSQAASKTDWTPLAGRDIAIQPDNDEPGRHYAGEVAEILQRLDPPATVKIVELPGLESKGDVADFIERRRAEGTVADAIHCEIAQLVEKGVTAGVTRAEPAEHVDDIPIAPQWKPYPIELLPSALRDYAIETARAMSIDVAHVAQHVIAVAGAAIGTTRAIELKSSWHEYPIFWTAVVARSGALKTPAMRAALEPLQRIQSEAFHEYDEQQKQYASEILQYQKSLKVWNRSGGDEPPPIEPAEPILRRCLIGDTTVEAIGAILAENPRGILMARDELSGWFTSFDQYKGGRGSDEPSWLELHRGGVLTVDRKSQPPLRIRRAVCSIAGTIQPLVLAHQLTEQRYASGMIARFLFAMPPDQANLWTDRTPPLSVVCRYEATIRDLLSLDFIDRDGEIEPFCLTLSPDALDYWKIWHDDVAGRIVDAECDAEAAMLSKAKAYAARLTLVFALVDDPQAGVVSADWLRRGCELADWYSDEQCRIYRILGGGGGTQEDRDRQRLIDWIRGRGGSVTLRDMARGLRKYRRAEDAQTALDGLSDSGLGMWKITPTPTGGRPTKVFTLAGDTGDGDKTPLGGIENRGCVTSHHVTTDDTEKTEALPDTVCREIGFDEMPPIALSDDEPGGVDGSDDSDWGEI